MRGWRGRPILCGRCSGRKLEGGGRWRGDGLGDLAEEEDLRFDDVAHVCGYLEVVMGRRE